MKDDFQMSHLPDAWGGPFAWSRNHRGNLELISVKDIIETAGSVADAIRAHLAEVSSR